MQPDSEAPCICSNNNGSPTKGKQIQVVQSAQVAISCSLIFRTTCQPPEKKRNFV